MTAPSTRSRIFLKRELYDVKCRGQAKMIRKRYVWTRIFSKTGEKKSSVFKNIRIRVDGALTLSSSGFWSSSQPGEGGGHKVPPIITFLLLGV